ncbi:hypothetical protein, partial [Verrucomicrobium spinosum]
MKRLVNHEVVGFVPKRPRVTEQIGQEHYEQIRSSKNLCAAALLIEERFKLVIDNFWEWEVEMLKHAQTN